MRNLMVRAARMALFPLHLKLQRFLQSCDDPAAVQTQLLKRILARQSVTAFGRDHGFAGVRTLADYRRQVPVAPYERLAPYIERVKRGETDALIADDRVLLFALTSGTTAARKFIPVTQRYLHDYRRGWTYWGIQVYADHRERALGLRPIVQMSGDPDEFRTETGIPCGNLSGFTVTAQRRFARRRYAVPPICGTLTDPLAKYYLTLRLSLGTPAAVFLAANPSTLVALGRTLDLHKESLLRDLHDGTLDPTLAIPDHIRQVIRRKLKARPEAARALSAVAEKTGVLRPQDAWHPSTTFLGTWTGGSMGSYLKQVPQYFGDAPIRDLGLLASEGRFTLPLANGTPSGVLDIAAHFFEFIPEAEIDSPNAVVLAAHELQLGGSYYLIPTTNAGLYRYHISDLVRVTGFLGRTPMVEFLGKGNRFANMTGEKLSEHHVTQALVSLGWAVNAYTVAPVWDETRPHYAILLEESEGVDAARLRALDAALAEQNIEYAAKRQSGRLGPIRAALLPPGTWAKWDRERLAKSGGSTEQYKRPCLQGDVKFVEGMPVVGWVG